MKLGWRGGRTGLEREGGARMKLGWRGGRTGLEREGVGKSEARVEGRTNRAGEGGRS